MNRPLLLATAGLAFIASATVARAHDATVSCDPTSGTHRVVADFPQMTPTWTFTPTTVVVTWADGYTVTRLLPVPCVPPVPPVPPVESVPTPTPAPAVTVTTPIRVVPPMPRKTVGKPKPRKPRVVTCSFVVKHYKGEARARMIRIHRLPKTCGRPFNPPVTG